MIKFSFTFKNPYAKDVHCKVFQYNKQLTSRKHFEAEHYYCNYDLFRFSLDLSWRGEDHAGPELEMSLFGYSARYKIYDIHHWDYSMGKWAVNTKTENYESKEDGNLGS